VTDEGCGNSENEVKAAQQRTVDKYSVSLGLTSRSFLAGLPAHSSPDGTTVPASTTAPAATIAPFSTCERQTVISEDRRLCSLCSFFRIVKTMATALPQIACLKRRAVSPTPMDLERHVQLLPACWHSGQRIGMQVLVGSPKR